MLNLSSVIETKNLVKRYFNLTALDGVSLTIPQGEVIGILGPNGAGKSTLFKIIAGLLNPDEGSIRPMGYDWPKIAYKPDRLLYPNRMRVGDYLKLICNLANVASHQTQSTMGDVLEQVGLESGSAEKKINDLSKGMRQRLGLAQSLIGNPSLLLLDEPSNGLDPAGQLDIQNKIKSLSRDEGKTILLSSHQLHEVTDVCTQIIIMNKGKIRFQSSMADALAISPRYEMKVDQTLGEETARNIKNLHPNIKIEGAVIHLDEAAIETRRSAMSILLDKGYDVLSVEQIRTSLTDIYQEAVR